MAKKFKTVVAYTSEKLDSYIEIWLKSINGVEVERSAPAIALADIDTPARGPGEYLTIAVTVTAEVKD